MPRPGPTGEYPDGKLFDGDQGALNVSIGRDDTGNIAIDFGTDVSWVAFPVQDAIKFAMTILKLCKEN